MSEISISLVSETLRRKIRVRGLQQMSMANGYEEGLRSAVILRKKKIEELPTFGGIFVS